MGFRLVPKSVTLNDLKQRNVPYFAEFGIAFGAHYIKVVDWPSTDSVQRNVLMYTNKARRTRCALRSSLICLLTLFHIISVCCVGSKTKK